jgi:putative membrane protein
MKSFGIGAVVMVAAVMAASGAAYPQDTRGQSGDRTTSPRPADTGQATRSDAQGFVNDMANAGLAEVQLGKLATERASDADVKAFGQMMVMDHSKANDELKQIASQVNIQLPPQTDQKHQAVSDKLSKLKGAEFDREYMNAMVEGHQEVLGKLRARVGAAQPSDALTQWATKAIPTVQMHLERATELQQRVAK